MRDQVIQVFALFIFSSSHPDTKYIIPLIIRVITAITATYLIASQITLHIHFKVILFQIVYQPGLDISLSEHQGSQIQFTFGADVLGQAEKASIKKKLQLKENKTRIIKNLFNIFFF
jgi:hypothetical protein